MADAIPCFVDFEASSLGPDSYPVALAWNRPDGEIRRFLINPAYANDWNEWDPNAEAIHGIDRQRLFDNGWAPDYVAEQFANDCHGQDWWADAPDFDNHWLRRLFTQVDRTPPVRLGHSDELMLPLLQHSGELLWQAQVRLEALKQRAAAIRRDRHDAGADVGWLIRLWQMARGGPALFNHGVGPMPKVSPTGSFMALKGRVRDSDAKAGPDEVEPEP